MERQKTDTRWVIGTAVLTLLLGVQAVKDLMTDDGSAVAIAAARGNTRQPASVGPALAPKAVLPKVNSTLVRWNCKDKTFPDKVQLATSQFRLKGVGCGLSPGEHITLINESNGFTASVFTIGKNGFETDLIQLSSGENRLHLTSTTNRKHPHDAPEEYQWTVFSAPNDVKSQD